MKVSTFFIIMIIAIFISVTTSYSQAIPQKKVYITHHVNPHSPSIDGKSDDPSWDKVQWDNGFTQREPFEGNSPTENTKFKILYDDKNLYVLIRAEDSEPHKVIKRMTRRDNLEGDWVGILIDSFHDLRTAFVFAVTTAGVKYDKVVTNDGNVEDLSWDPAWDVATTQDEIGWTAEMRIPFHQLRFNNEQNQVWGIQVSRKIFRKSERCDWQFVPKDASGWVSRFGELHGIQGVKSKPIMEFIPYIVGKMQRFPSEPGNPFATGKLQNSMIGIDGKIGVTRDLTMDFTLNPDFGQVEADPSEVNLTTFETFFEEKRPFFIEGRNILDYQIMGGDGDFSYDNLFYTRRIGRVPHYFPQIAENQYLDVPMNTSILGAFKLTGKTRNGLSIGIMDSLTGKEKARIDTNGERKNETVEPLTNYFMFRLQKDYNQGKTIIGGMLTAANRSISQSDPRLNYLHKGAYTGGFDLLHSWKDRTYEISLKTVFSYITGSKESILYTQLSPVHYYQRADATHFSVDPNRTSLFGHGGTLEFSKSGKGHIRYNGGFTWRSPGLELNDMGYLRSADTSMQWTWVGYNVWKPFSIFRSLDINFNQWSGWGFDGVNRFNGGNINGQLVFKNYWSFYFNVNPKSKGISVTRLRGGPSMTYPGGLSLYSGISTDGRKSFVFEVSASSYRGVSNLERNHSFSASISYRPISSLNISCSPSYSVNNQILQYVTTSQFQCDPRYLFGSMDQKTARITFRMDYSITPDLSIQFYGQPFISAGKYKQFKQIINPNTHDFKNQYRQFTTSQIRFEDKSNAYYIDENGDNITDYYFSNPNFNFFQFRSNLVLRWEYRPGSTIYAVWSQGRTGYDTLGDFAFGDNFSELFHVKPHNVFLIKCTYRLNI